VLILVFNLLQDSSQRLLLERLKEVSQAQIHFSNAENALRNTMSAATKHKEYWTDLDPGPTPIILKM
jgi:hypothetical protein